MKRIQSLGPLWSLLFLIACNQQKTTEKPLSELAQKGKDSYMANCIACHNVDPSLDGSVGPAVSGSSYELIYARVTEAKYPEGYKPKRTSTLMPAMPHLASEVKAIDAFLNKK
jgi:mono/diheme cytochrome c family protein